MWNSVFKCITGRVAHSVKARFLVQALPVLDIACSLPGWSVIGCTVTQWGMQLAKVTILLASALSGHWDACCLLGQAADEESFLWVWYHNKLLLDHFFAETTCFSDLYHICSWTCEWHKCIENIFYWKYYWVSGNNVCRPLI